MLKSQYFGINKTELDNEDDKNKYKTIPACYYCVVRASNPSIEYAKWYQKKYNLVNYNLDKREVAYKSALAREKQKLTKLSDFISGSGKLENK